MNSRRARIVGPERWVWVMTSVLELVRQRLRSPGQILLGLRAVDQRTGRRLKLWRSLACIALDAARHALTSALAPHGAEAARQAFISEARELARERSDDPVEREAEMRALFERHPQLHPALRSFGPGLAIGLLTNRLGRRLARTTEVVVRGGR